MWTSSTYALAPMRQQRKCQMTVAATRIGHSFVSGNLLRVYRYLHITSSPQPHKVGLGEETETLRPGLRKQGPGHRGGWLLTSIQKGHPTWIPSTTARGVRPGMEGLREEQNRHSPRVLPGSQNTHSLARCISFLAGALGWSIRARMTGTAH